MAQDQLALLVQRAMTDPTFVDRARTDLDGTLAAEGISLDPAELEAARSFQAEVAGLSADEVRGRLSATSSSQGVS